MIIVILVILLLLGIAHIIMFHQFPLHPMDPFVRYDVGIVLGSPTNEDGSLSTIQKKRMDCAIEHYSASQFSYFLISGGCVINQHCEALTMASYAQAKGIAHAMLWLDKQAQNTYENLYYAKSICAAHNVHTVLIITSKFHMRRASFFAAKFFDSYALVGTQPKEKWKYYIKEYFAMWNTLWIEYIHHRK